MDLAVSLASSGGRFRNSAPYHSATRPISESSEDTITFSNSPLFTAAEIPYAIMGCPKNERRFLPGRRFEPPRAGMIATGLPALFKAYPLPFLSGRTSGKNHVERKNRIVQGKLRSRTSLRTFHKVG